MEAKDTSENRAINFDLARGNELLGEGFVETALHHRWVILATAGVFMLLAFTYLLKATPLYTSVARLYVEQTGPKLITDYEGVMTRSTNYLYTQCELIKSTPIVAKVAGDKNLAGLATFKGVDNVVGYLKKNLKVGVGKKDDIITVALDSAQADEAAEVVNAVVDSYVSYHASRKRSTVSEVLRILQKEKVKRDKELSEKFQQMLEFTREHGVIPTEGSGGNVVFQRLAKLSEALTDAQLETISAEADYQAITSLGDQPEKVRQFILADRKTSLGLLVDEQEAQLRSELKELQLQLKDARYNFTDEHPYVKQISSKIKHIEAKLAEYSDSYIDVMQQRQAVAKKREQQLLKSFEEQRKLAQDVSVTAAEYAVLQAQLSRTERLCEILDNRIKELNVTEDAGALNICVLEAARPALKPSHPQKAKVMGLALLLGLMIGFVLALVRDWMDYTLRSSDEIAAVVGKPILGVIPSMSDEQAIVLHGQRLWRKVRSLIAEAYQTVNTDIRAWPQHRRKRAAASSGAFSLWLDELQDVIARCSEAAAHVADALKNGLKVVHKGLLSKSSVGRRKSCDVPGISAAEQATVTRGQKVRFEPWSLGAEAYRTVRTAVFFNIPKNKARTILVTSPAPGDGKSTLVSNLGIAMAQAGQKTLILDADFRKPMQHKIFESGTEMGLSHILAEQTSLDAAIQKSAIDGLDLLVCGQEVQNPAEILNSDAFFEVLDELRGRYDRIIIDSPPITPVADSQILGAICDVVILVIRAEKCTRKLSEQARDSLASVGANVLGVVVNDAPRKRGRYGYYYYSGYKYRGYYGYGRRKEPAKARAEIDVRKRHVDSPREKLKT